MYNESSFSLLCSSTPFPTLIPLLKTGCFWFLSLVAAREGGAVFGQEGGPSCFADEKAVLGVWCLDQAGPRSQDRGQAVCLELGALDHAS